MRTSRTRLLIALSLIVLFTPITRTAQVRPLFDLTSPAGGPFPSDRFTEWDPSQITGLRVNLPKPDCELRPSDCEDTDVINTLDGFNLQPRLSIPFDGAIDVQSVTSDTVFLIKLACPHDSDETSECDQGPTQRRIGINQIVWDPVANVLHVESDALLEQHTRYALIVTRGIRSASGGSIVSAESFVKFRRTVRGAYKDALLDAVRAARHAGVEKADVAAASVFTTRSVTAVLERIRDQIKAATPLQADFQLGPGGSRTVFALEEVTSITLTQQNSTAPLFNPPQSFTLAGLRDAPAAVGHLAFGKFSAPDYQVHPGDFIPPIGTRTGSPVSTGLHEIHFNLVLPSGTPPPAGWPVAVVGHGGGGNKEQFTLANNALVASLATRGIATIAINAVGHGLGPLGWLSVNRTSGGPVVLPSGGRGVDQNGDGVIEGREGIMAARPRALIDDSDGFRQTVADLMQLVRQIEVGMDVDGDALPDLDPSRVFYAGQSLSSIFGTPFLAVEPGVRAASLSVPGGPRTTRTLTTLGDRRLIGTFLAARDPSLINAPGVTRIDGVSVATPPLFNENLPLRDSEALDVGLADRTSQIVQSPVTNNVTGALSIQEYFERAEWVMQSASPVAYAPYLRHAPLAGMPPKPVIIQFAKGDQAVPNPATTAMLRAGYLADRATFYRHDLAFAENPALPKNPHGFMPMIGTYGAISRGAQEQIVAFFASNGEVTIHPEPSRFFEVPIAAPLPEGLNWIP